MKYLFLALICCYYQTALSQQKRNIGGRVTDDKGSSVVGASVSDKSNPKNRTVTDFEGSFSLQVDEKSKELEVSSLGFKSKTVVISKSSIVNITLEQNENELKEVAVKGFGSVASKARVRMQSIQSLPETTVAINAQTIEADGINNIQTFTSQISNVTFNQSQQPGVNFLTVRGISQIRNGESPVAVVIDGMTLPDASAMNMSLYDIELLEFVKGPQGTLYGKNAIAGAINITTKDPTNKFKNKITVFGGNGGLYGARLLSSGPLVKNKFYYSLSGGYKNFDGLITNTFLHKKEDFSKEFNVRAKLKYVFDSQWSATFVQDNFEVDAGGNYHITKTDILDPSIPPLADNDYSHGPSGDIHGDSKLSNSLSSLKIEGNLTKVRLQSVTSYNATRRYYMGEQDYSKYAFSYLSQDSNSDTFSEEFRLVSKGSKETKFDYTVGALFQNSKRYLNGYTFLNKTYYEGGFIDYSAEHANYSKIPSIGADDNNTIMTVAGFVFGDYKITSKLTVSAGVRVDNDQLKNDAHTINTISKNNITVWQPKFSLAYQFTGTILGYVNYGRGYRSGGFNSYKTVKFGKEYKPEFTNNYEIGLKTSFLNNRIIFNNAFYYIDFENQQQYTFMPFAPPIFGIYNIDRVRISGFESEIKFKATNNLDFFASVGFNDSKIKKGTYNLLTNAAAQDYTSYKPVDISGNTTPYSVKSTFQIGGNANFNLSEKSTLGFYVNVDHRGKQAWDSLEEYKQEPFTLVNARVNLNISHFGLTLWSDNIFNTKYNQEFFPTAEFGFANVRFPCTPTTIGLDLSYKF